MLIDGWDVARALILLVVANGAPVLGKLMLGARLGGALDGGRRFLDGRPILGPAKSIRGVMLSVAATSIVAPLLGIAWQTGMLFGVLAMAGDLLSSFIKRRLGIASSRSVLGLDQVPESLLPLLVCRTALSLSYVEMALLVAAFFFFDLVLSRLLYRLAPRASGAGSPPAGS